MTRPSPARRLAWRVAAYLPRPVRELVNLPARPRADVLLRSLPPMPSATRRLYVGPRNTAGQAWQWARATERHLDGDVAAQNLWAQRGAAHFHYPADHRLSSLAQRGRVRALHGQRVLEQATHVLFESGRPVLADFQAGSMLDDLPALRATGIRYGVVYHGSDVRDLRRHAEEFPHSPFRGPWDDYLEQMQQVVRRNVHDLESFDGPVLVSTPDLLAMVPGSVWLPVVVDVDRFASDSPVLERARPVVLHAPSNPRLKGAQGAREQLEALAARGLVEYRLLQGVSHQEMAAAVGAADIVLDQFALGATGVFAAECQAAGRVVLAHLAPQVRAALPGEPPVVEATPGTVGEVVEQIVADRAPYQRLAALGPAYARAHHDGRAAARVLEQVLLHRSGTRAG